MAGCALWFYYFCHRTKPGSFGCRVVDAWCRWWVPAALALDAALRFIGFPSLTKTVGICVFRLAREYIGNNNPMWGNASETGAPKQVPVTHPRVGAGQRLGRPRRACLVPHNALHVQ